MSDQICKFDPCDRTCHRAQDLCETHYRQRSRGARLSPIKIYHASTGACGTGDCDRDVIRGGFCDAHYRTHLATLATEVCALSICESPVAATGLCERHRRLTFRYNLSVERLVELFADARCDICGTSEPGGKGFHIDHDHACCGAKGSCGNCVRGLLCGACNSGLGQFRDSVDRMKQAIVYLEDRHVA